MATKTFKHGVVQGDLYRVFRALRPRLPVYPCVETRMNLRPGVYRIPDVAVFLGAEPPDVPDTPPLIAIEILSPGDRVHDVFDRLQDYCAWNVSHIWLVEPKNGWIYAYNRDGGLAKVQSLKVPELDLELHPADVFGV